MKSVDRELTGGRNSKLNQTEQLITLSVEDVFSRQQAQVIRPQNIAKATLGGELLEEDEWNKELAGLVEPSLFTPVQRGGNEALRRINVDIPEWIEDPRIAQSLKRSSLRFARNVNKTTFRELKLTLIDSLNAGESSGVIASKLRRVFDDKLSRHQAEAIARSEYTRAQSLGQIEAWKQTGVVHKKVWLASGDACPFCLEMNGKVIGIDENFQNEGSSMSVEYNERMISMNFGYTDVIGPPLHPNCRCTIVAEIEKQ